MASKGNQAIFTRANGKNWENVKMASSTYYMRIGLDI